MSSDPIIAAERIKTAVKPGRGRRPDAVDFVKRKEPNYC